jgi:hypothetical protein
MQTLHSDVEEVYDPVGATDLGSDRNLVEIKTRKQGLITKLNKR